MIWYIAAFILGMATASFGWLVIIVLLFEEDHYGEEGRTFKTSEEKERDLHLHG